MNADGGGANRLRARQAEMGCRPFIVALARICGESDERLREILAQVFPNREETIMTLKGWSPGPSQPRLVLHLAAILISLLGLATFPTVAPAQVSSESRRVPDDLKFIFDLPWCKRWKFSCMSCRKEGITIACQSTQQNCTETFEAIACQEFNLPPTCRAWSDGCNTCSREPSGDIYCTAAYCRRHLLTVRCLPG